MCSETNALGVQEIKVKPGYKMTELGVIPEDWDVIELSQLAKIQRGASPRPIDSPIWFDDKSTVGWVRISDVTKSNKILSSTIQKLSPLGVQNSRYVEKDNLIMSICATLGRPIVTKIDVCIHDGFVVFKNLKTDTEYLYYFLKFIEDNWSKNGQTGSQMNLNTNLINITEVIIPKDKNEQKLIAQTLSDTDDLINSLDELIEKKEKIKEGAMQELLTGKRRLPGFDGEWEIKKISDILDVTRGYVLSVNEMSQSKSELYKYPVYSSQTRNKGLTGYYKEYLYENSITWTTDGANAGDVNYREGKFYCTNVCGVLKSNNGYANLCVAKALGMISKKYVSYIGNPKLMNNVVAGIELKLPPTIEEQKAIAEVLSDMDNEIENLKTKRDKYKQIKEGMMQELLTGKIRLV